MTSVTADQILQVSKDTNLSVITSSVNVFLVLTNSKGCDILVVTLSDSEKYLNI